MSTGKIHSFLWHQGKEKGFNPDAYERGYLDSLQEHNDRGCHIIPFDVEGRIVSTWMKTDCITRYEVRYFLDGNICTEYFFDDEITFKEQ